MIAQMVITQSANNNDYMFMNNAITITSLYIIIHTHL